METIIITLGFCFAGAIIGWTANDCVRKFKQDKIGMRLRDAREKAQPKIIDVEYRVFDPLIVEATKIIEAHQKAKKVFKALREDDDEC